MKTLRFAVVFALLAAAPGILAQVRGLPPNAPVNPNWVISPWGHPPNGTNWLDLKTVNSMTYDRNGTGSIVVLVTPKLQSDPCVWVFDFDGNLLRTWGANMFVRPYDLIVDPFGNLWIVDLAQNYIAKFTEDGKLLMTLGQKGVKGDNSSHDAFNGPSGLAINQNGDIFVADGYYNSRVVKFDRSGKFLMMIGGTKGSEIGQFNVPHHVWIDSKGELVIQDRVNKRIQFWTQDGKFIKQWTDIPFGRPSGMAMLPDDTMYFTDSDGHSVRIVKDDKVLDAIAVEGVRPHAITIDPFGALYVNDEPNRLVRKLVLKSTLESQRNGTP
jgi:peptidylamidoglycolate lyase